jgi:hypothetical protein
LQIEDLFDSSLLILIQLQSFQQCVHDSSYLSAAMKFVFSTVLCAVSALAATPSFIIQNDEVNLAFSLRPIGARWRQCWELARREGRVSQFRTCAACSAAMRLMGQGNELLFQ